MPRDDTTEKTMPEHASATPPYPPNSNTSGYSTRGKRYQYSHTKPPVVAPPAHSTKRPPVPASAARKKISVGPGAAGSNAIDVTSVHNQISTFQDNQLTRAVPNLPDIPEEQEPSDLRQGSQELNETALDDIPEHAEEHTQKTPGRHPDIQIVQPTPDRANLQVTGTWGQESPRLLGPTIAISSPSPFAVRTPPAWAVESDDNSILNPSFVPNPTLPLNLPPVTHTANLAAQSSAFSFREPESPIAQRQLLNETRQSAVTTGSIFANVPSAPGVRLSHSLGSTYQGPSLTQHGTFAMSNTALSWLPVDNQLSITQTSHSDNSFLSVPSLDDIQRRSVSPQLFTAHAASNGPQRGASQPVSRSTTPQTSDLASLHSTIVQGLYPPAPPVQRGPSPVPSVTGPWATVSGRAPTPSVDQPSAENSKTKTVQRAKRHNDFSEVELLFVDKMTLRWQWYLLAENAFPVDTLMEAQELCILYAEDTLGLPRSEIGNGRRTFGYVRCKDSRIRNDSQCDTLSIVENSYEVTCESSEKLKEFIKHSNFMYTSYNVTNVSAITGRYRHPCISAVLKQVLFPPRGRGLPPGARFIRQLIAMTPRDVLWKYEDPEANYGAPVGLMALACTLILHALRLLQQGYSSHDEKSKKKKPLILDEATYGNYYRKLLKKMEGYPRLGEVRRDHMKPLLQAYSERFKSGLAGDGLDDDDDIEHFSDGE